jgi:hypothetical protein
VAQPMAGNRRTQRPQGVRPNREQPSQADRERMIHLARTDLFPAQIAVLTRYHHTTVKKVLAEEVERWQRETGTPGKQP